MTKILGLSGKKQSGKSTACNYLFGLEMRSLGMVGYMKIDEKGRLCVPVVFDGTEEIQEGCIDPLDPRPEIRNWYQQTIWPFIKAYQLADPLKWVCQHILGLTYEQCNGSNEQKDTKTKLLWNNMPVPLAMAEDYDGEFKKHCNYTLFRRTYMTGREVMQWVGTQIFRSMYPNVWIDATIRAIQQDKPGLAIVTDCRFPNEVEGIQKAGGKVIRFTRAPFAGQDEHASETALDEFPADFYDHVIDNSKMTIGEQCMTVNNVLTNWNYIDVQGEATIL